MVDESGCVTLAEGVDVGADFEVGAHARVREEYKFSLRVKR